MKNQEKAYSLNEAVANIAHIVAQQGYYKNQSRPATDQIIEWAVEFEKKYKNREWDGEYYDTLDSFIVAKMLNEKPRMS